MRTTAPLSFAETLPWQSASHRVKGSAGDRFGFFLGAGRIRPRRAPLLHRFSSSRFPTRAAATWTLGDLSRVSESSSPLIFRSTSKNPYVNLSIEHFLLTHSHHSSRLLFLYTNRPCVVIGRNQNPWVECDLRRLQQGLAKEVPEIWQSEDDKAASVPGTVITKDDVSLLPVDLVRRRSGGGAVFHDLGNLNYSVIVPNDKDFQRRKHAEMVVRSLQSLTEYDFGDVKVNERNDIVLKRGPDWLKVSGSAFKLTRGRALHHGTLLYSSPYLGQISQLLRSPGRPFIHAKGVESVRSKVGNLLWVPDHTEREALKKAITGAIVREFWNMYGQDRPREEGDELEVGDHDCTEDVHPKLAAGVKELLTAEWRFEQTPRFDFESGIVDGAEVQLHVSHGKIEKVQWRRPDFASAPIPDTSSPLLSRKLHSITEWHSLLNAGKPEHSSDTAQAHISPALVERISTVFPAVDSIPSP